MFGCTDDDESVDQCRGVDDRVACDPTRRIAVERAGHTFANAEERVKDPRTSLLAILMALFLPMLIASSNVLVSERTVYARERLAGLNILPYVTARLWVLWMLGAVVVTLHIPIAYFLCGLEGNILKYWLVGFFTTCTASAMGMALSAAVSNPVTALWGINFLAIPQLLFAGSISRLEGLTGVFSWLTATRYGLEALANVDLRAREDLLNECQVERFMENMPNFFAGLSAPDGVPEIISDLIDLPLVFSAVGLSMITFLSFVTTVILLKLKDK
jgi:hypothetical protein